MAVALSFGGEGSTSPTSVLRLCVIVGGVTMLNALWNCIVLLCHPSFREQRGMRLLSDPWARDAEGKGKGSGSGSGGDGSNGSGYSATASADDLLVAYLRNNPEVAHRAVQGAVAVAVQPGASAAGGAVLAAAAGGVVANSAAAGGKATGAPAAAGAPAPAAGPGAPGNRERGKSGGSFLAVLNPFRGAPKPHAASGSGSVVDVADFPEPAGGKARGSRAASAIAGDATVAHNPFHNVGAAAGATAAGAPGGGGAAAMPGAPGLGALERGESAANVFAMEASLDATSYGRPPSVRINGPGGAPAAQPSANPFG